MAGTFVEHVNNLAINLTNSLITNINTLVLAQANIDTVATNIAGINSIVTNVIPNMTEILLADDNAVIATTQAGIATTKASEASISAAAALVSEQSTASLLDQFDDRYLGSKAIEPLLDNDGNALLVGALYFDSVVNRMRVYGSDLAWSDALTLTTGSISTLTNKTIDSITNQIGADHIHYKVRNNSASIIPLNTVVVASGTQPGTDYINVLPITDPQAQIAVGIVHTALAINGSGLVINTGVVDDFNTSAWAVGTLLYPSTTGGLTTVKPTVGRYQVCAIVLRQHLTQGTLLCEFSNPELIASTTQEGYVQLNDTLTSTSITQALTAAQGKVLQDGKQPIDPTLTALAGVVTVADQLVYATGVDTFAVTNLTTAARTLLDDVDVATMRTTLGAEDASNKGAANGYAPLGADLKVPAANLPAYVDDVLEYANLAALPVTGTSGIIYITVDTNRSYRWSGTAYIDITGMVDSVNGVTGAVVLTATNIGSTPVGTIAATNVQAAIQELASEKVHSVVAGNGIIVNSVDPLNPIVSAVPTSAAGILSRMYATGDTSVLSSGTYYLAKAGDNGTVASVEQTVAVDDNQKLYFAQDFISAAATADTTYYAGTYAGTLTIKTTDVTDQKRFTIEVYKTDINGTAIDSGISSELIGDLGVKPLTVLSTGIIDVPLTEMNAAISGTLSVQVILFTNQRIRFHVSGEKIGTIGGIATLSMFAGYSKNSALDIPIAVTTDTVINKSGVTGATATDVLNTLSAGKADREVTSGAVFLGSGTTLQRPTLLSTARAMWYNTDLSAFEGWNGTSWGTIGGGATGGGADTVFVETSFAVTQSYTLTAGKSAMTVGDANGNVTIANGATVTIPTGAKWVIL